MKFILDLLFSFVVLFASPLNAHDTAREPGIKPSVTVATSGLLLGDYGLN
jgi:hypothetical protein